LSLKTQSVVFLKKRKPKNAFLKNIGKFPESSAKSSFSCFLSSVGGPKCCGELIPKNRVPEITA
jgi:hypothetical protein